MNIREAKEKGRIPEKYHKHVIDKCACGADLFISKNLKVIKCVNPNCYEKKARRMASLIYSLGIKNVGPDILEEYYMREGNSGSMMKLLLEEIANYPTRMSHKRRVRLKKKFDEIRELEYKYKYLVRMLDIPDMDLSILKIFNGINSYAEYQEELEEAGSHEALVRKKLETGGDIIPYKYADRLREYDSDIKSIESIFSKIRYDNGKYVEVAMTGIPPMYSGKEEFLRYLEDISKVEFILTSSLKDAFIIIYARTDTEKYNNGMSMYPGKMASTEDAIALAKEVERKRGERNGQNI